MTLGQFFPIDDVYRITLDISKRQFDGTYSKITHMHNRKFVKSVIKKPIEELFR